MVKPLISVIMPVYNAENYIHESVKSILGQSYDNFELIIVDDCSTDASLFLVKQFKDERIKIYCNDFNRGVSYSRNFAINMSQGQYVAMLDDDDIAEKDRLKKQMDFLENNKDIDAVGCKVSMVDDKGNFISYWNDIVLTNPKYIRARLLMHNVYINSAMFYRKSAIEKNNLKFHENAFGMEDYIFLLDFSSVANISGIDEVLVSYRIHSLNTTKVILSNSLEERKKKWRDVHVDAIRREGFHLSDSQCDILLKAFNDDNLGKVSISDEEKQEIKDILNVMIKQAETMKLDNLDEFIKWVHFVLKHNHIV